jgi:O-antigen/teichoic acid export membrane protein
MSEFTHRLSWRSVLANSSWYLFEKAIRLTLSFLVSVWVARYLGPHEYGTLALGIALTTLAAFMVSLGVETIVVRDLVQNPDRETGILSAYFFLRVIGGVLGPLCACGYVWLAHPDDGTLILIVAVLSLGPLLMTMDLVDCALQARHQARLTSLTRALAFIAASVAKCSLILVGADVIWFAVATIVENVTTAIIYFMILRSLGVHLSLLHIDWQEIRTFLKDGRLMMLSGGAVAVYSRIDSIIVGSVVSATALANYALAVAMLAAWNLLGVSATQAIAPHLAVAHQRSRRQYLWILRRFLQAILAVAILGSAAISLMADTIFAILLGGSYALGGDVLRVLIWSSVPAFLGVATTQILINERLYWVSLLRTLLGMAVMVALIYPVATRWGGVGVAYLVLLSYWIATLSLLFSAQSRMVLLEVLFGREMARSDKDASPPQDKREA